MQKPPMSIDTEFPDFDNRAEFDAMGILLGAEFVDSSWHNDTCPSYYGATDETRDSGIQVFIDYRAPEFREFCDHEKPEIRFYIVAQSDCVTIKDESFSDICRAAEFARELLKSMKQES